MRSPHTTRPLTLAAQGDREVVMTRSFAAPRERVFDAWTKPELVKRWFGGAGFTIPECEIDLRPGGRYRWVMQRTAGPERFTMTGTYREILRPVRLVNTQEWEGFQETGWRAEDVTVNTMVLTEVAGGTLWTATVRYASQAVRDAALSDPNQQGGMNASFARLDEVLGAG
jgi:uncharacterized protein YndB with AHSA1/START domain